MLKFTLSSASLKMRRALIAMVAAITLIAAPLASSQSASAQEMPNFERMSSDIQSQVDSRVNQARAQVEEFFGNTRDQAWNARNDVLRELQKLNPAAAKTIQPHIDNLLNVVFPGLVQEKKAEERAARDAAARANAERANAERARAQQAAQRAEADRRARNFDTGSCPADAKVCVDIDGRRTWLQDGRGTVTYVSPSMAPGRNNPTERTPRGTFTVTRKVEDEISYEFNNAPMPYAVYFTNNGHAFHMGDPAYDSAGCVRLPGGAAERYFAHLNIGDKVYIY